MNPTRFVCATVFILLTGAFTFSADTCAKDCPPPETAPLPITQGNPAAGWSVVTTGSDQDPLAAFGRRPIDEPRIIPLGGQYQDPERGTPHYGIDYTFPEKFLNDIPQPIYPIGPGFVTAVHTCPTCWVEGSEKWGRLRTGLLEPRNNFGFGNLVVIEHPYNDKVSFYTLYAHLRQVRVHVGQYVDSETQIALLGASGDVAAPHVHIELRFGLPGDFWAADFNNIAVMRRWLQQDYETPIFLLYAEHHVPFTKVLERWVDEEYPIHASQRQQ